jgi:hypothetical protein
MAEPLWSEDSFHVKERKKWDTPKSIGGMKCNGYEPYPKMLYKAQQNPLSGKFEVGATRDVLSTDRTVVIFNAEQFSTSCQLIVNDEREEARAKAEGWRNSPKAALDYHEGKETESLVAAAVRAHEDRNMSDAAKAEAAAVEAATDGQVAEIPTADKRRESLEKARAAKAAKRNQSAA